jgi:G3E family GTPase
MLEIADRPQLPDMVVIEASGVADPAAVSANAYIGGFHLAATLVLVDAINAQQTLTNKLVGETFVRQINAAHLLLITKEDTATTEQYASCIDICESTSLPYMLRSHFSIESLNTAVPLEIPVGLSDAMGASFSAHLVDLTPIASLHDLRRELDNLPHSVVRAKGIVCVDSQNYLVQRVGTYVSITATRLAPTGIVVIHAD